MTPSENNTRSEKDQTIINALSEDDNDMPLNTSTHAFFNGGYGQPYEKCEDDWLADNSNHVTGLKPQQDDSNVLLIVFIFAVAVVSFLFGVAQ